MFILYTNFTVSTELFGDLEFSTATCELMREVAKLKPKSDDSRRDFIKVIRIFLKGAALSEEDISKLSDDQLEKIGQEFLTKSYMADDDKLAKMKERGFFDAFWDLIMVQNKSQPQRLVETVRKVCPTLGFKDTLNSTVPQMLSDLEESRKYFSKYYGMSDEMLKLAMGGIRLQEDLLNASRSTSDLLKEALRWQGVHGETINDIAEQMSLRSREISDSLRLHVPEHESIKDTLVSLSKAHASISDFLDRNRPTEDYISSIMKKDAELVRMAARNMTISNPYIDFVDNPTAYSLARVEGFHDAINSSLAAQKVMGTIDWREAVHSLGLQSENVVQSLEATVKDFSDRYADLYGYLERSKAVLPSIEWYVTDLPPIEMYTTSTLLRSITHRKNKARNADEDADLEVYKELEKNITGSLEEVLAQNDPDFLKMWRGAREALKSRNPDKQRHVIVSLRELVTQAIHRVAPDEDVKLWTSDPKYFHQGKPTRKARLLYAYRHVAHGPFLSVIEADVKMYLTFIDAFQKGTHKSDSCYTDEQLEMMMIRTESLLRTLFCSVE